MAPATVPGQRPSRPKPSPKTRPPASCVPSEGSATWGSASPSDRRIWKPIIPTNTAEAMIFRTVKS